MSWFNFQNQFYEPGSGHSPLPSQKLNPVYTIGVNAFLYRNFEM